MRMYEYATLISLPISPSVSLCILSSLSPSPFPTTPFPHYPQVQARFTHKPNKNEQSVMRHVRRAVREGGSQGVQGGMTSAPGLTLGVSRAASSSPWPLATLVILELHLAMDMILTACRLEFMYLL